MAPGRVPGADTPASTARAGEGSPSSAGRSSKTEHAGRALQLHWLGLHTAAWQELVLPSSHRSHLGPVPAARLRIDFSQATSQGVNERLSCSTGSAKVLVTTSLIQPASSRMEDLPAPTEPQGCGSLPWGRGLLPREGGHLSQGSGHLLCNLVIQMCS